MTTTPRPGATTSAPSTPPAKPTPRSCSPTPQRKRPSSWSALDDADVSGDQVAPRPAPSPAGDRSHRARGWPPHTARRSPRQGNRDARCRPSTMLERLLPSDPVDPALPFLFLGGSHLDRWRGNALAHVGDAEAIDQPHPCARRTPSVVGSSASRPARRSRLRLRSDRQPRRRDEPRPGSSNDRPADQLRPPAAAPRPPDTAARPCRITRVAIVSRDAWHLSVHRRESMRQYAPLRAFCHRDRRVVK